MIKQDKVQPATFSRLRIPKGSELLAKQVRQAIMGGELSEGSMLPPEKELMAQLGLSRATVREGLRLLEADGLISTRPGRGGGAVVQRPGSGAHTKSLATMLQFDELTYDELFEAWNTFVTACGRLATKHATPEQLAELRSQLREMALLLDKSSAFIACEVRFHMSITHATNNPVLRIYGTSLAELTYHQLVDVPFSHDQLEAGLTACQAILESLEQGDAERTEARLAKHLAAIEANIALLSRPFDKRPVELAGMLSEYSRMTGG